MQKYHDEPKQYKGYVHAEVPRRAQAVQGLSEKRFKALFMTVWCPDSRSVESNCGIPRG